MNRGLVRLFKYVGLLGCGLSAVGLVLAVGLRIDAVFNRAIGGRTGGFGDSALQILDAFKEPGSLLLLSSLVYVVCEIALQLPRRSLDPAGDAPHD